MAPFKLNDVKFSSESTRAIFLDRDGVLNKTIFKAGKPRAPASLEDFQFFEDAHQALIALKAMNFLLIVVTNQPDVARGWQKREVVEAMNERVLQELGVHGLYVCYHVDADGCSCRKPKPGMLQQAALDFKLDLTASFLIGDRMSDVAAGKSVGCTSILLGSGDQTESFAGLKADFQVASLREAVRWIEQQKLRDAST